MLPRHNGPTGGPPSALCANGAHQHAHRRRSREVGQVGRAGLVGIVWRLLRPFRYLIGSREPAQGRARPMRVRSNLRHVPCDEGARDLGKTRFSETFRKASRSRIPGLGKGLR